MPEPSDEELIDRLKSGDVGAFSALVERHIPMVYRTAAGLFPDRFEAEDVTQEVFARLWRYAPVWTSTNGDLGEWLQNTCSKLSHDRLRKRNSRPTVKAEGFTVLHQTNALDGTAKRSGWLATSAGKR